MSGAMRRAFLNANRQTGRSGHRCLSTTTAPVEKLATHNVSPRLSEQERSLLKPDTNRMLSKLHRSCEFGKGPLWTSKSGDIRTGMSRLALSNSDKRVRDWFKWTVMKLGCKVTIDAMGNMFAVRPGRREGPATFVGSHLDTQPTGGRYDGILGVHAGIEMLNVLEDKQIQTEFPVGVVNWTNEEGARFPISMMGSGVWAGSIPLEDAYNSRDVKTGVTVRSELERIGYKGKTPADYNHMPMAAHFELHIEQGPKLEKEEKKIGIVLGVQAYKWFTVTVTGAESHTGTTDMPSRHDPLINACVMILRSQLIAQDHGALAGTGILNVEPGSTNTIPGKVTFSLDLRAVSDEKLEALVSFLQRDFEEIAYGKVTGNKPIYSGLERGKPCSVEWRLDFESPAVNFDEDCIGSVREAAQSCFPDGTKTMDMTSGAGHDSVCTSRRCPTSMIFVPSQDGVSHNPKEFTSPLDCVTGAEVLMKSVLSYDKLRAERVTRGAKLKMILNWNGGRGSEKEHGHGVEAEAAEGHQLGMEAEAEGQHDLELEAEVEEEHKPGVEAEAEGQHDLELEAEVEEEHKPGVEAEAEGQHDLKLEAEVEEEHKPGVEAEAKEEHKPGN